MKTPVNHEIYLRLLTCSGGNAPFPDLAAYHITLLKKQISVICRLGDA